MLILFGLGLTAFALCLILTPLCRNIALRLNLVDEPDNVRKFHTRRIPRLGGVAIVLAYVGALALVFEFAPPNERLFIQHRELLFTLLPSAGIVFLTGLLDDLIGLKPWQKLAGQAVAAVLVVSMGTHIQIANSRFFTHHPALATPWLVIPLSIVWLLACTNAVNLIDGLDGLACGVGLFATVTTLLAGIFTGNTGLVLVTLPLAGCLLGFLCFNFNPASIFLGDCGSLTIGFALGCFGLVWSQRGGTMLGLAAPLMALALPILDVGLAICRRYLRRVPIFKADRGHIHHMVLARGNHPRKTAMILYAVSAAGASLALLQSFSTAHVRILVILLFLFLAWSGVKYLGYTEFGAARRTLSANRIMAHVRGEIFLDEMDRSIATADNAESCWGVVQKVCAEMHFDSVSMQLHGSKFNNASTGDTAESAWRITLPLSRGGYLKLSRRRGVKAVNLMMVTIERLQEDLSKKVFHASAEEMHSRLAQSAFMDRERASDAA